MLPPDFKVVRSGGPPVEPLSLTDAKNYLRVGNDDDNALIVDQITAARIKCEQIANSSLVPSSYLLTADYLPYGNTANYWSDWVASSNDLFSAGVIELPFGPLIAVQSINYVGFDGITHLLDPSTYHVSAGLPGQIQPKYGTLWPFILPSIGGVQITYSAGIDTTLLSVVRNAMRLLVGHAYEHRSGNEPVPSGIEYYLNAIRFYGDTSSR